MSRTKTFAFSFDVSDQFLRESPAAQDYIEMAKARIAARTSALGPRGGVYRLVTPPEAWRQSNDAPWARMRNLSTFATTREGRYVRPDRVTADLILGDTVHLDTLTVPVVEGRVVLPRGTIVETTAQFVDFPVLVR